MDHTVAATVAAREVVLVDKMRLDSFRLGRAPPALNTNHGPKPRHARSHSRNGSVSVPLAFPPPVTTSDEASNPPSPTASAPKRNSHHRRRSSVSTRRESADMMGLTLPSIPASVSDENINLGDRDSVRRRALWALEGKTEVGDHSKVQIPEFDTAPTLPTKPSFPPGVGLKREPLGNKRDSLTLSNKRESLFMASSSTMDQLGTLMEEEEEEEEHQAAIISSPVEVQASSPVPASEAAPMPTRHRPTSLNLRPLSLINGDLPTPVLTSTPNPRPGLRSLTLPARRQSLVLTQTSSPLPSSISNFSRRSSVNFDYQRPAPPQQSFQARSSSISYVCSSDTPPQSMIGLPTPDMTPTTCEKHFLPPSASHNEELEQILINKPSRPLSTSEQHFLFQAHATLVQRITDLERALSSRSARSWSRPTSIASDISSAVSALSEPSDEMLQLIADLKAERDELKKDVDGWRVRVGDLEHQLTMLAKRVEAERRDAWVARERGGLLEVEKSTLEKALAESTEEAKWSAAQLEEVRANATKAEQEVERLKEEVQKMRSLEEECAKLREALEAERKKREEAEHELERAGLMNTPRAIESAVVKVPMGISRTMMFAKRGGLGFQSIDSEGSFTDVESEAVDSPRDELEFGLKSVQEEDEETLSNFSEEDELARFEDEEEDDAYAFPVSLSASSFASDDEMPVAKQQAAAEPSPVPSPVEQMHVRRASLSKTWTFPVDNAASVDHVEEVDRFFGCLEDVDNSPPMDSRLRSLESGKNLFAQALAEADDEFPPFVIPAHVGVEVVSPRILEAVQEEDEEEQPPNDPEDEFVGKIDEGGIVFTFTVPPEYQVVDEPVPAPKPVVEPSIPEPKHSVPVEEPYEEEDSSFTFPQARPRQNTPSPSAIPRLVKTSPSPVAGRTSTPVKKASILTFRSPNIPSAYMTPPSKRVGGSSPTFIPQPRGSPNSPRTPSPTSAKMASFIPQPRRASSGSPALVKGSGIPIMSPSTGSTTSAPRPLQHVTSKAPDASPRMNGYALSPPPASHSDTSVSSPPPAQTSPQSPSYSSLMSMSPTMAARLSFQTLTNYIPLPSLSWSSRTVKTSAAAAAALCFAPDSPNSSISTNHGFPADVSSRHTSSAATPSVDAQAKDKAFVQREKQLEKLRLRMEEERRLQRRGSLNTRNA